MTLLAFAASLGGCPEGDTSDAPASPPEGDGGAVAAPPPRWLGVTGERLGPLPPQAPARSDRFVTSDVCSQCHRAGDATALRDAKGRDISPVGTWRTSPMALAARDPYYLAAVADELAFRPQLADVVNATCTRCHAPEAAVELADAQKTPTFAMLTTEVSPLAHLAREGVACTLCHQIAADGLGSPPSFTGGFMVGLDHEIYGPYASPTTDPMRTLAGYVPGLGEQIQKSALCATCHTVITKPRDARGYVGPDFPEQVPYLEWLASSYSNEGRLGTKAATCQDCHMPAVSDDNVPLESAISVFPTGLAKRKPFWRHGFAGANVFLSKLAASDPTWIGAPLTREDHAGQASASESMLRTAATLALGDAKRAGEAVEIAVTVTNTSGHKLPTGYPSRRAWLHVRVRAPNGEVVFESGRSDAYGRIVGRGDVLGEVLPFAPHLDVVEREDQVQIYESVPVDASGKLAHRPLDAHHYAKDNRLLPAGFDVRNRWAAFTSPIGTERDGNFRDSDVVTYRMSKVPAGATIEVRLLFQVARPSEIEALADAPTPAARKLFDLTTAAPPLPVVIAEAKATAP